MTYTHLTIKERIQIETLLNQDFKQAQICKAIGITAATLSRELKRNDRPYDAQNAQSRYDNKKRNCGAKTKLTDDLKTDIEEALSNQTWSPESYAGRHQTVSFKSIYRWYHQGLLELDSQDFRRKGKKTKTQETRGKINRGRPISERPESVEIREEFGHWELDTVVSARGKDKACLATFVERKSRAYFTAQMPDRSSTSMVHACEFLCQELPTEAFKSVTCDNGKEFSQFERMEEIFGCEVYFADPYSSWQRGSNENTNGLIREFFPKGTLFSQVTWAELHQATALINNRPRKVLGFKTNYEILREELLHLF